MDIMAEGQLFSYEDQIRRDLAREEWDRRMDWLARAQFWLPDDYDRKRSRRGYEKVRQLLYCIETSPPDLRTVPQFMKRMGSSRNTILGARSLGQALGVLSYEEILGRPHKWVINWAKVATFVPQQTPPIPGAGPLQFPAQTPPVIGGVAAPIGGVTSPIGGVTPPKTGGVENAKLSGNAGQNSFSHLEGSPPCNVMTNVKPIHDMGNGDSEKSGRGGWPIILTREVLAAPKQLLRLYEHACLRVWIRPSDVQRRQFFAAARSVWRRSAPRAPGREAGPINNPGGAFTRLVKLKAWSEASDDDDDWARKALRELDYGRGLPRPGVRND